MAQAPTQQRDSWKSSAGFLLAAVGSAVGLGNLWRFAYTASEGGGAAFVLLYMVLVVFIGIPVMTAELAIGRSTGLSPVRAMSEVGGRKWAWVGAMFVLGGFAILSFYSVIMGWTGRLLLETALARVPEDTAAHFGEFSTGGVAIAFHLVGMAVAVVIVRGGIHAGIERAARILMPLLFLLLVALAVWAATLSGASEGYRFYLQPDFSQLLDTDVIAAAAGQAFFSLSLGMGAIITYASYLRGHEMNLPKQGALIAFSDMGVALLGGLVTFPIIFHFALQDQVSASTVGALFIALPRAFNAMGPSGTIVGTVFFIALYIAALTSAISLLEVVVSGIIDGWGWVRNKAAVVAGIAVAAAGIPSALSLDWLGFLDKFAGEVVLVFGGMLIAILTGWIWDRGAAEELAQGFDHPGLTRAWIWLLRTIVPIVLAIVLVITLRQAVPLARALLN